MTVVVSYCGLVCQTCPIYLAAREPDKFKKEKMISDIIRICKEEYGIEYNAQDITDCDGCMSKSGVIFSGCKNCKIRKCAMQKNVVNCAHCNDYPCSDLNEFLKSDPSAKMRLDQIRRNL